MLWLHDLMLWQDATLCCHAVMVSHPETWLAWWQVFRDRGSFWASYLTFITTCVSYAGVAGCLTSFGAPLAADSGIPEVKTYLNGVHIQDEPSGRSTTATCSRSFQTVLLVNLSVSATRSSYRDRSSATHLSRQAWTATGLAALYDLPAQSTHCHAVSPDVVLHAGLLGLKTLLCKLVGVCFSMAGGLIAGKEGPFVHSGDTPVPAFDAVAVTHPCIRAIPDQ